MGDKFIGDLFLEKLDKAYQEGIITVGSLEKNGIPLELIIEASDRGLIKNTNRPTKPLSVNVDKDNIIELTIGGFELLNQIRIKKSIKELDNSIKKFNESSDKSSDEMIRLTRAISVFTVIVVALPIFERIIQFYKVTPPYDIILLFVGILIT